MSDKTRFGQKILIVDDSEMNRDILSEMLGKEYEIIEAENGEQAVAILQKQSVEISLVLLDIVMPVMDGYEVLAVMNSNHWIEDVPVIMISSESSPAVIDRAYELGVSDFISRPFDALIVRRRVVNTILLYAKQKKLEGLVADQIYEKEKNSSLMIAILSHIVEFRNGESGLHVLHVQNYTEIMLRRLIQITDKYNLSSDDITLISNASALHDIGKISIDDAILNKPGKLTKEEFEIMKTHSSIGASMLGELSVYQNEPLVKIAYEICRWHHERYDGRGYPDGLSGDKIPISAQVVALADVYDALTSKRVYKKAFPHETAVNMILNGECGTFNPIILECFQDVADEIERKSRSDTMDHNYERELQSVSDEMIRHEELSASERTLNLLKHERMKNNFFTAIADEIYFEYTEMPALITFSALGAKKLGIREYIMDPLQDAELMSRIGEENLKQLSGLLRNTTPKQPVIQYDCKISFNGDVQDTKVICRAVWSSDEPPRYTGAVGKFVQLGSEEMVTEILEQISFQDTLTGLMNYEYSKKLIQKVLGNRKNSKFVLAIIDVDGLDTANRKYGHAFGDNLLMHMAERVRRCIKKGDIAARAGGDEILLFVECDGDREEEIRRIFASLGEENGVFPVSVCIGAVMADLTDVTYDVLLLEAGQALCAAKKSGKGQICFYDSSMKDLMSVFTPIDERHL
ncbi:MAG: response regulator [Eubacteriales bacterium]|nr:response regulator [Eubacteriales bacterium]